MKKENQPHPDAMRAQQELMLKLWENIPAEQQASLALKLVQAVREGEWGEWLQEELHIQQPKRLEQPERPEVDSRLKPFTITSVCRADMKERLSEEEIALFDDADMQRLANKMEGWYVEESFWTDMELAARRIMEEKGQQT